MNARQHMRRSRAVWAAVTRAPCAPLRELAAETGMGASTVRLYLRELRALGYIAYADGAAHARTIVVGYGHTGPPRRAQRIGRDAA